jgi:5'-nucleotidase
MALQLQRLEIPAKPGVAFSLVKKLLAFNPRETGHARKVEVVILSRNDPVSGMRVIRSRRGTTHCHRALQLHAG